LNSRLTHRASRRRRNWKMSNGLCGGGRLPVSNWKARDYPNRALLGESVERGPYGAPRTWPGDRGVQKDIDRTLIRENLKLTVNGGRGGLSVVLNSPARAAPCHLRPGRTPLKVTPLPEPCSQAGLLVRQPWDGFSNQIQGPRSVSAITETGTDEPNGNTNAGHRPYQLRQSAEQVSGHRR
jgi:hypothetical protein